VTGPPLSHEQAKPKNLRNKSQKIVQKANQVSGDPMKPALLVVDVQKAFFNRNPVTTQSLEKAIEYINAAIALFRERQLPVICVQHMDQDDKLVPGEDGFELPDQLNILASDLHIHKTYGNSFNKTPLEAELRKLNVDTVIITGFCAEYCVLSTYRGAEDLDLTPILLRGSLARIPFMRIKTIEKNLTKALLNSGKF
jgi:nicotinamidase-related amidase